MRRIRDWSRSAFETRPTGRTNETEIERRTAACKPRWRRSSIASRSGNAITDCYGSVGLPRPGHASTGRPQIRRVTKERIRQIERAIRNLGNTP